MGSHEEAHTLLPVGEGNATDDAAQNHEATSAVADNAEATKINTKSEGAPGEATGQPAASSEQAVDFFAAAGVIMPAHLDTKTKRWASLVLVLVSSSLASGPMQSWPTLTPLLIEEGVWEGHDQERNLSKVYSLAIGVALVGGFISGLLFDVIGPRVLMMVGAFGVAVCQVMMAVAVEYKSMNFLLWYVYPAATCLGWANLTGVYAWLWLLPEDESLVSAMIGTIQILADMFVLVAVWLHSQYGLGIQVFFIIVGVLSIIAGVLCSMVVPTLEQHKSFAATVRNFKAREASGAQAAGAALAEEDVDNSFSGSLRTTWRVVRDTMAAWFLVHPGACWLFIGHIQCFYMWIILPTVQMYEWYLTMFDKDQVTLLLDIWGLVYGLAGAVLLLAFGALVDKVGFVNGLLLMQIPTFICTALMCIADFNIQVLAQVILAGVGNGWQVILPAFCIHYIPQELFGTFWGLIGAVLGLCEMILTPLTEVVASFTVERWEQWGLPPMGEVGFYRVSVCFWFLWAQVLCLLYICHIRKYPVPSANSTTIEHVRRAIDDRYGTQASAPSHQLVDA